VRRQSLIHGRCRRAVEPEQVHDYTATRFEDAVRDVDLVLDAVGGDTRERSWGVLRRGGTLVTIVRPPSDDWAAGRGACSSSSRRTAQLGEIARLIDVGRVQSLVEAVYPLTEARRAYERGLREPPRGRLVLRVIDED
jgi:NADPH:quinone reductase-like Zn-dependent oxidoreductase